MTTDTIAPAMMLAPQVAPYFMEADFLNTIGRKRQNWEGSSYILFADDRERQRLNLQHDLLTSLFEGKLLQAPVNLNDISQVLEVGVGTGIWLLNFAKQVASTVVLQAIDIETHLYPKEPLPNMSVCTASVTSLPLDWNNRFDLVHQRFLCVALRKEEWVSAIAEIYRVLRPGGWADLTETGELLIGTPSTTGAQAKLIEVSQYLEIRSGLLLNCEAHIPTLLEQAGFCNVKVEKRFAAMGKWGGQLGSDHVVTLGDAFSSIKEPVMKFGGFGIVSTGEEFDKLVADATEEWNTIPGTGRYYFSIIAQKPSA